MSPISRPGPEALALRVRGSLQADPRITAGARIVVAVSGGPDSVALLRLLADCAPAAGVALVVAHLDHGLRGVDGEADSAFVAALAGQLGLPCRTARVDSAETARLEKRSLEDAARMERRRFLERVRQAEGAAVVALGHTRDDQAETLLLNLLRGAGPRGLGAMPAQGPGPLLRPLLGATRREILAWLDAVGQAYRTDDTNSDHRFTRNRIRHELLPRLAAEFNPAIAETLARAADLFQGLDEFLESTAAAWLAEPGRRRSHGTGRTALGVAPLRRAAPALRSAVLRHVVGDAPGGLREWGQAHLEALGALIVAEEEGALDLPGGWTAWREGAWLHLADGSAGGRGAPRDDWPELTIATDRAGETVTPRGTLRLTRIPARPRAPIPLPTGRRSAAFDAAVFPARLIVRPLRPGDRLRPLGAPGHRKVVDLLAEAGIPPLLRGGWPVVGPADGTSGNEESASARGAVRSLLWVPGARRGDESPVRPETRELIILEWFGDVDPGI